MAEPRFTNRLVHETSPYLRQHAHNPVDWYPWGEEALRRARELGRPIFLSVGYSACHWCHVMEHESFENEAIAAVLNEHFVSIKVDREERPDLDQIYMAAVQMISGQGGWPMSMFLTPDLRPFTGGTYFPPEDRWGRPGFRRILLSLVDAWKNRQPDIEAAASELTNHLQGLGQIHGGAGEPTPALLTAASQSLAKTFDARHGGFGRAPKFLHTMDIRVLLREWKRHGNEQALHMATHTLLSMSRGGIYDHLGGGFARYSTDERWLAPHFEKMLYDNALIVVVLLEAYQATGDASFRETVEHTLAWLKREMTSPEGPFYSTLDADSEGEEGKFYVWKQEEIDAILGPAAPLFSSVYNVSPKGNWADPHAPDEPKNILHLTASFAELAQRHGLTEADLRKRLALCRQELFLEREKRVRPGLDDKCLTAWNGLMINALATAASVLDRAEYADMATRAADFILTRMRKPDGSLLRTWSRHSEPKLDGYLEDHAYLMEGLVSLYEATFEQRWIDAALDIARVLMERFADREGGGFYFTGAGHEALITRSKDQHDNATPAAGAVAVAALFRLVKLTGRNEFLDHAVHTMRQYHDTMQRYPSAASQMMIAADFYMGPVREFAVIGRKSADDTRRILRAVQGRFLPNKVVGLSEGGDSPLPLLQDRPAGAGVRLYVCENFACQAPLDGAEAAEAALAAM
jgi:uncharacterized protein YyaL (SSP411 family)